MLLEWSVLKWKEKVALKNRKSAGADRSRVCVVGVGLYEIHFSLTIFHTLL